MRRIIPIALLLLSATFAHAQSAEVANLPYATNWLAPTNNPNYSQNIDVVTLSEPTVRHTCHLRTITSDAITCRANLSHKIVTYNREQIAALIDPPNHYERHYSVMLWVACGAALAASFFVPLAASVVLRIIASFLFVSPAMTTGDIDHDHDRIFYRGTNAPLAVALN